MRQLMIPRPSGRRSGCEFQKYATVVCSKRPRMAFCWFPDPTTRQITDINPYLIAFLGYSSRDEVIGKELFEIMGLSLRMSP